VQASDTVEEGEVKLFDEKGAPLCPVGQIIFDMNGEYANANMQDAGTAIFEQYKDDTVRYSVLEKTDFRVMKINFFEEVEAGFNMICQRIQE